ncbi:hypothetical protein [Bacillus sp. FJAT-45350]|uniref:hypothetical protein n=1 Tax=Bacillus sp. FJAT-45350 TaxID=2011014 RepID=UPI000BB6A62F|nr:hypothetical protein [Bacillus sp. FJAT-45350]
MIGNRKRFFSAIEEYQTSINLLKGDKHLENHQKSLLFNLIEMIANGIYGSQNLSKRQRFLHFIENFSEWEDANRVSMQQIILTLEVENSPKLSPLKSFCENKMLDWPRSQPISFKYDPLFEEVQNLWPQGLVLKGNMVKKITLSHFKHCNLMWRLRNSLVHEMRPSGISIKLFDNSEPHYVPLRQIYLESGELKSQRAPWQIFYPIGFYNQLIDISIPNIKNYLEENNIDPLDNFNLGYSWVK